MQRKDKTKKHCLRKEQYKFIVENADAIKEQMRRRYGLGRLGLGQTKLVKWQGNYIKVCGAPANPDAEIVVEPDIVAVIPLVRMKDNKFVLVLRNEPVYAYNMAFSTEQKWLTPITGVLDPDNCVVEQMFAELYEETGILPRTVYHVRHEVIPVHKVVANKLYAFWIVITDYTQEESPPTDGSYLESLGEPYYLDASSPEDIETFACTTVPMDIWAKYMLLVWAELLENTALWEHILD